MPRVLQHKLYWPPIFGRIISAKRLIEAALCHVGLQSYVNALVRGDTTRWSAEYDYQSKPIYVKLLARAPEPRKLKNDVL